MSSTRRTWSASRSSSMCPCGTSRPIGRPRVRLLCRRSRSIGVGGRGRVALRAVVGAGAVHATLRRPGSDGGPAFLLGPAGPLVVDVRRGDHLSDGTLAAQRTRRRALGVDAMDHLEPPAACRALIVVGGHLGAAISRGAGACRTSGSRRPARARMRSRSARRRGRRGRPRASAARRRSDQARTGWPGCC